MSPIRPGCLSGKQKRLPPGLMELQFHQKLRRQVEKQTALFAADAVAPFRENAAIMLTTMGAVAVI